MIVTNKFVFIHLHKTGGRFVREIILNHMPSAKEIGYHFPITRIPEKRKNLPLLAFVRNPYSWYASWFNFNAMRNSRNPVFLVVSNYHKADFTTVLKNLLRLGEDTKESYIMRKSIRDLLADKQVNNRGHGLVKKDIETLRQPFYHWQYSRMLGLTGNDYADEPNLFIGKTESLRQDLLRFLVLAGVEITDPLRNAIKTAAPVNSSGRCDYKEYYDKDLVRLVAKKEHYLLEKYHYTFT